jgi:DNA (cytosine-5)-methyltransferase 1
VTWISTVDLFCGIGGLTYGLESVGIPVSAGVDIDEDCEYPYESNTGAEFEEWDLTHLTHDDCGEDGCIDPEDVADQYPEDVDRILVGCAPCQPFSTMGNERGESHDKYDLLEAFGTLIDVVDPDVLVTENVPKVIDSDVYADFRTKVEDYYGEDNVWSDEVDCQDYGVPQTRKRLLLMASNYGEIELLPPTHPEDITVRKAIEPVDLPRIAAGEDPSDDYQLHFSAGLVERNIDRMKQSEPGGSWKDWDDELVTEAHRRKSGQKYTSCYGRMEWDELAPTITTEFYNYGSGRFGHPDYDFENPENSQKRAISFREGALLQTFPMEYEFLDPEDDISRDSLGTLIGNAVPVRLAEVIGESIQKHLEQVDNGRVEADTDADGSHVTWLQRQETVAVH